MSAADIAMWVGVLGLGSLIPQLAMGLFNLVTGKQSRERDRLIFLVKDRDDAEARSRIYDDYIASLRRQLLDAGLKPEPWPRFEEKNE